MASRLALVAFSFMLFLAGTGARWLHPASTPSLPAQAVASDALPRLAAGEPASGAPHILWNGALWLFGLGLAASLARNGGARQPALE